MLQTSLKVMLKDHLNKYWTNEKVKLRHLKLPVGCCVPLAMLSKFGFLKASQSDFDLGNRAAGSGSCPSSTCPSATANLGSSSSSLMASSSKAASLMKHTSRSAAFLLMAPARESQSLLTFRNSISNILFFYFCLLTAIITLSA